MEHPSFTVRYFLFLLKLFVKREEINDFSDILDTQNFIFADWLSTTKTTCLLFYSDLYGVICWKIGALFDTYTGLKCHHAKSSNFPHLFMLLSFSFYDWLFVYKQISLPVGQNKNIFGWFRCSKTSLVTWTWAKPNDWNALRSASDSSGSISSKRIANASHPNVETFRNNNNNVSVWKELHPTWATLARTLMFLIVLCHYFWQKVPWI